MSFARDITGGNLVVAAQSTERDLYTAAAFGLIGGGTAALQALAAIDQPEARLFHALALWVDGQDDEAARMVQLAPTSDATSKLAALLKKDRVRVLGFLPHHRGGPHCLFASASADPRFEISNVWFHAGRGDGLANRVDASIHHFYRRAAAPDFLVSEMVEWHVLPRNLAAAPFHKIAHTSDFDIHGQEVIPWLRQFDTVLTLDHTEWARLRRAIPDSQVLTYPKAFTIADRASQIPSYADRPIDVLMTGTVLSDYHNDKNELLTRLTAQGDLKCMLLNGFVSPAEYENLTRRSKLTLSFVRHSGTMPTRALESLSLGTWSLVQADSAIHLYLPKDAALLKYKFGDWVGLSRELAAFFRRCAECPEEYVERAALTRSAVYEAFAPSRVGSQYMRFCAALPAIKSAMHMSGQRARSAAPQMQKRGCVVKGWLPADGDAETLAALRESNLKLAANIDDYSGFNDAGRENLIEYARLINAGNNQPNLLEAAIEAWGRAIAAQPGALAPRFNLIRALYHFGATAEHKQAERLIETTLALHQSDALFLKAEDDLLPYDFQPSYFNGQICNDLRLEAFGGALKALDGVRDLIIASLHYYRARAFGNDPAAEAEFDAALALDRTNIHFRVGYAQYLLSTQPRRREEALESLRNIASDKSWTPILGALLHVMGVPAAPRRHVQFFDIEGELARRERYALSRCLTMTGERFFGLRQLSSQVPKIALIVCGAGISASESVCNSLANLRQACPEVEIVAIDTVLDCRSSPLAGLASLLLTVPQAGVMAYSSMAIGSAITQLQSKFVVIAEPDMADIESVVALVRRLAKPGRHETDIVAYDRRPVLLERKSPERGAQRELLAVGAPVEMLRVGSLPQSTGMLQAANLTLPILAHQLRAYAAAFYFAEEETGSLYCLDKNDPLLELSDYVAPDEGLVLSLISPNWNRFIAEASAFSGPPAPFQEILEVPQQPVTAGAALLTVSGNDGGVNFGRDSFVYGIARSIYRRYLKRDDMAPGELAVQFGFVRFEYMRPHLRVRFCRPRMMRR